MTNQRHSSQEETFHLYLDGELTPDEQEVFIDHLQQCKTCQTRLAELQALFAELGTLEEMPAPVNILPQVMANLPASNTASRYAVLGRIALVVQIIVGLTMIFLTWPMIVSTQNSRLVWQSWLIISDIGLSLNGWLMDLTSNVSRQVLSQWPPTVQFSGFNISSSLVIILIITLGLAWLIGNGVLLRYNQSSTKNGGIS